MGKDSEYTELGEYVVGLLRERRLSQRKFAAQLRLSPESFRRWFRRGDPPKLENLEMLEDGLQLQRGALRRFWKPDAEIDDEAVKRAETALHGLLSSHGVNEEHRASDVRLPPSGGGKMYADMRSFLEGPEFARLSRDHRLGLALLLRGRDVKPVRVLAAIELLGLLPELDNAPVKNQKRHSG